MNQQQSSTPVVPFKDSKLSKKEQVAQMFNNIAFRYDFLNHFLSVGIDHYWRKVAINQLKTVNPQMILDVATGTGDLAIAAMKLKPRQIVGIDISEGMLNIGREKMKKKGLDQVISLQSGDSEHIEFPDNTFDGITAGFGVRNFENLEKGLKEMYRVLKPGGKTVILEFSKPVNFPVKQLYSFYFRYILPGIGKLVSKSDSAYTYLPDSVQSFPQGTAMTEIMQKAGFKNPKHKPLTLGICSIYTGEKA